MFGDFWGILKASPFKVEAADVVSFLGNLRTYWATFNLVTFKKKLLLVTFRATFGNLGYF